MIVVKVVSGPVVQDQPPGLRTKGRREPRCADRGRLRGRLKFLEKTIRAGAARSCPVHPAPPFRHAEPPLQTCYLGGAGLIVILR